MEINDPTSLSNMFFEKRQNKMMVENTNGTFLLFGLTNLKLREPFRCIK